MTAAIVSTAGLDLPIGVAPSSLVTLRWTLWGKPVASLWAGREIAVGSVRARLNAVSQRGRLWAKLGPEPSTNLVEPPASARAPGRASSVVGQHAARRPRGRSGRVQHV